MGSLSNGEVRRILGIDLEVSGRHFVDLGAGYGQVVLAAAAEGAASAVGYELCDGYFHYAPLFRPQSYGLPPATTLLVPADILDLHSLEGAQCVYSYSAAMPPEVFEKMVSLIAESPTVEKVAIVRPDGLGKPQYRTAEGFLGLLNGLSPAGSPFVLDSQRSVRGNGGGTKLMFVFSRKPLLAALRGSKAYTSFTLPTLSRISFEAYSVLTGTESIEGLLPPPPPAPQEASQATLKAQSGRLGSALACSLPSSPVGVPVSVSTTLSAAGRRLKSARATPRVVPSVRVSRTRSKGQQCLQWLRDLKFRLPRPMVEEQVGLDQQQQGEPPSGQQPNGKRAATSPVNPQLCLRQEKQGGAQSSKKRRKT